MSRYWLNTTETDPVRFEAEVHQVCELYAQTPHLAAQGIHVISTDEMTGIQALEVVPLLSPLKPGQLPALNLNMPDPVPLP